MKIQDLSRYSMYRGLNSLQRQCLREEILKQPQAPYEELIKRAACLSKQKVRRKRKKFFSNILNLVGVTGVLILFFMILFVIAPVM
ncbi:hypothetical protein ABEV55_08510 [Aneurinibacillus thermoaerophilus]|uniref:hypothetical protein n=1 Tax=Aneurinibacillus thermoaerophilus TaxID=143495 RepID=UPI002E20ACBF|nr:hypothetical protein [Aneurinibacillus thermoaerophilus]